MRIIITLGLWLAVCWTPAQAQAPDYRDFAKLPQIWDVEISPDGA